MISNPFPLAVAELSTDTVIPIDTYIFTDKAQSGMCCIVDDKFCGNYWIYNNNINDYKLLFSTDSEPGIFTYMEKK